MWLKLAWLAISHLLLQCNGCLKQNWCRAPWPLALDEATKEARPTVSQKRSIKAHEATGQTLALHVNPVICSMETNRDDILGA